jgi:hypothetical protein
MTAQDNPETLRSELTNLTKKITQLYNAKEYDNIDSLNLRRENLFKMVVGQGYGSEGEELLIELDYNIARIAHASSSDNPVILNMRKVRDSLARQRQ